MLKRLGKTAGSTLLVLVAVPVSVVADPIELDSLWDPFYGGHTKHEGWLEFINPREHPNLIGTPVFSSPPGAIFTEEYTGYTTVNGVDITETGDSDRTHGDRADFDWVQEHRPCETGGVCNKGAVNHPGQVGAMGWTIGTTEASNHTDPGTGQAHNHSQQEGLADGLPALQNNDYTYDWFNAVDVFSIISLGEDEDRAGIAAGNAAALRAAALDYIVDFGNTVTGASTSGILQLLWIPGWTNQTYIDDYVARWVPSVAGLYNVVAIEPGSTATAAFQTAEIDAIKGLYIPEPTALTLIAAGMAAFGMRRRQRASA